MLTLTFYLFNIGYDIQIAQFSPCADEYVIFGVRFGRISHGRYFKVAIPQMTYPTSLRIRYGKGFRSTIWDVTIPAIRKVV
jgi:hypothetical protein